MKEGLISAVSVKVIEKLFAPAIILVTLLMPVGLFAQADSTKKADTTAKEEASLVSPTLDFVGVQKGDNTIDLKATLKAKINTVTNRLALLKVTFVQVTDAGEQVLGFKITDANGKAVLNIKADSLTTDKEGKLLFKAMFGGNKAMETADGEVTFKRAHLEITPVKEDSVLNVKIKLSDVGSGKETPVGSAVVGIYVNRLFFPLKLGEGTTDSTTGEATVEIPAGLPGDTKGNITIVAKLDENEVYGNLETTAVAPWGTAVSDKVSSLPRALWSPHPPIWMVVTFVILMSVVWGHYIVIVVQLFRLRKEEPHSTAATV